MAAEILLIAPDMDLYERAKKLRSTSPIPFDVAYAFLESAVELAARIDQQHPFKVIISRGATLQMLRESDVPAALVDIKMGDFELLHILSDAKKISSRIAVVGFLSPFLERAKLLSGILGFEIGTYIVHHSAETQSRVRQAVYDGYQVIVGVERPCNYAMEMGVPAILFTTSPSAINNALMEADKILTAIKAQQMYSQQQTAILNTIRDGIFCVSLDGVIQYCNTAAASFIPGERTNIADVFGSDILALIGRGQNLYGEVLCAGKESFAANISPIIVDGKHVDTIISFSPLQQLQEIAGKTRLQTTSASFSAKYRFSDIITQDQTMLQVLEECRQYAKHDITILISGESGTGKELLAQSIHQASLRRDGPFVGVNCAALPNNLLESELFGYAAGAFTGARKNGKAGLFELAHRGTLFLDEIGEITPEVQARLLRVLEEKTVMRVGDDKVIYIDARIIFASNRNLLQMVKEGKFRKDLYYRINVLHVHMPALAERSDDIPLLLQHFAQHYCKKFGKPALTFEPAAIDLLQQYAWPGNIRELRNITERIVIRMQKNTVTAEDVFACLDDRDQLQPPEDTPSSGCGLKEQEQRLIRSTYEACRGNKDEMCRILGISKTTLWRRLKELQLP